VALSGPTDGWTIQLPSSFTLFAVPTPIYLGEPENAAEFNQVAITGTLFLTWDSDQTGTPGGGPFPATSILIPNAGLFVNGGTTTPFDLTLADRTTVPDAASTALLLSLAAGGLLLLSRRQALV
jgi:hypothetical protein